MMLAHTPRIMAGWISQCVNAMRFVFCLHRKEDAQQAQRKETQARQLFSERRQPYMDPAIAGQHTLFLCAAHHRQQL
jgi:hypothetical protein